MPYIQKKDRDPMDLVVKEMHEQNVEANGKLNYVLFKYFMETVGCQSSYNQIKNYCAELNETANEIRRRFLSNYEDTKIVENGDVKVDNSFYSDYKFKDFTIGCPK